MAAESSDFTSRMACLRRRTIGRGAASASRMIEAQGALERALTETQAEMIWCPAFEGAHQDHDAASALASRFTARAPVWEFAEYNNIGGRTHSQEFPNRLGGEIVLDLAPGERRAKRELLGAYASEHGNLAY